MIVLDTSLVGPLAIPDEQHEMDLETSNQAWTSTLVLSDRHGLTPYDAAYIELAQRRGIGLATRDRALASAAGHETLDVDTLS